MADVVKAVRIERMGRDVYIMGAANVGKSAFVRYMPSLLWPVTLSLSLHCAWHMLQMRAQCLQSSDSMAREAMTELENEVCNALQGVCQGDEQLQLQPV